MNFHDFPEANRNFGPPSGMEESQVRTIPGYQGEVMTGSCEGAPQIVVAYKLTPEEIEVLKETGIIYLSMLTNGLPPHFLCFSFYGATHPA